jgi:hypothetical protein
MRTFYIEYAPDPDEVRSHDLVLVLWTGSVDLDLISKLLPPLLLLLPPLLLLLLLLLLPARRTGGLSLIKPWTTPSATA